MRQAGTRTVTSVGCVGSAPRAHTFQNSKHLQASLQLPNFYPAEFTARQRGIKATEGVNRLANAGFLLFFVPTICSLTPAGSPTCAWHLPFAWRAKSTFLNFLIRHANCSLPLFSLQVSLFLQPRTFTGLKAFTLSATSSHHYGLPVILLPAGFLPPPTVTHHYSPASALPLTLSHFHCLQ